MAVTAEQFGRVAVLMGGTSAEREISLLSGKAVVQALISQAVDAHAVDVGPDFVSVLANAHYDRAFIMLHGRGGEDGVIQGMLEMAGIPYTGSGVEGSAISMDKYRTKLVWQGAGLPTPGFVSLYSKADRVAAAELGLPLMIKPVHEGSSIGMAKVDNVSELDAAWQDASQYDQHVIAERWIRGEEYTVGILGTQALPLIRLKTPNHFYDYEAKYEADTTEYLIPSGLDGQLEAELQTLALQAFRVAGASGWGRVDLMLDEDRQPWLIEVNTVPGMTSHSLVPMAAASSGMSFEQLVWAILQQTLGERS